jgi:hypothetical protein
LPFFGRTTCDPITDKLKRFGIFTRLGEDPFVRTLGAAVKRSLRTYPVDGLDWQDWSP